MNSVIARKIFDCLNQGDSVAAEFKGVVEENRVFVRIRALAKEGIPREEYRYLNSRYSMWEYWDYEFRRMELSPGWEADEWNYDRYLVSDERKKSSTEKEFLAILSLWVVEPDHFVHICDSRCPE